MGKWIAAVIMAAVIIVAVIIVAVIMAAVIMAAMIMIGGGKAFDGETLGSEVIFRNIFLPIIIIICW